MTANNSFTQVLPEGRPLAILAVEYDTSFVKLLNDLLCGMERVSAKIVHESTAGGAISQLIRYRYDIVILDLAVPGADGLEIMERFINAPLSPPAMIVVTADLDSSMQYESLARGAQEYTDRVSLLSHGSEYVKSLIMRALYRQHGFRLKYLSLARFINVSSLPAQEGLAPRG